MAFLLVVGLVLAVGCHRSRAQAPPPPPVVEVARVQQRDVLITHEWVATLDGNVNVQIQPQVTGYIQRQTFREGSLVQRDEILFEIDPRPFLAALDQARAQREQAQAQHTKIAHDVERDELLWRDGAIPASQYDTDLQASKAAEAAVRAAEAQVQLAQVNLGFTKIHSSIEGIAGLAQVQIGSLVAPTTVLTTVSQVQPIKAYFAISQQEYLSVAKRLNTAALGPQPPPPRIDFHLILADGAAYPQAGTFLVADRQVDPRTGTLRVAISFPNPDWVLRPGQFGRVRADTEILQGAVLVPQRAVTQLQGSYQVAVVGSDNKVSVRTVQVGPQTGSDWVITRGLRPDETVVVEGAQKVRDGMAVSPKPYQTAATPPGR